MISLAGQNLSPEEIKILLDNDTFTKLLHVLASKVNELDTVRGINLDSKAEEIGYQQLANYRAIEIIEKWLDEILSISQFKEYTDKVLESEDNIFKFMDNKTPNY